MSSAGKVIPMSKSNPVAQDAASSTNEKIKATQVAGAPRHFPLAATSPRLPAMIPDEILDYYGWIFCQGGFSNLDMTFEGFLAVVAAVSPSALCREHDATALCACAG